MATDKRGTNKKFRSVAAINREISRILKGSNVPVLKELGKVSDFLTVFMKNPRYYQALTGGFYMHLYSAIVDAIKVESAVMCREVVTARKAITPGVWTDCLFMSMTEELLTFGGVPLDDPKGEYYMVVRTIEHEIDLSDRNNRVKGYTTEQLDGMPSNMMMRFSEYSESRFTDILNTLVTAILSRCVLLSAERFTPFVTTDDQPSIPIKLCNHFVTMAKDSVEQWVNNEYGDRMDEGMKSACDSYTKYTVQELMQYISALATYGGINPTLVSAVIEKTSITPTCDYESFSDIADLRFSITYIMNYNLGDRAPISASFSITPGHIMNVSTHKSPSVSARRAVGRMMNDAVTSFVRYCMIILSEDPDIIARYNDSHTEHLAAGANADPIDVDVADWSDNAERVHPDEQD